MNEGVNFDRFYTSPVCSPTRASLLTGRHSLATGVYSVTRGGEKMFADEQTMAEIFKKAGYRTGLFGKWHNGLQYPYDPNGQGFDEFYGFADGHITDYFDGDIQHNQSIIPFQGYLPDRLTDHTLNFMAKNQQPFFAMLSFNTPHSPFELPEPLFAKYKAIGLDNVDASVYGMVENIDDNLARVIEQLDQHNLLDNTIIVFLSDNGPAFPGGNRRYNGEMKGWKGKLDEGGVRVPFAIYWRGELQKGHQVSTPGQHIDILPTLLSLTGIEHPPTRPIHGADLRPALQRQPTDYLDQRPLYTHHFRNTRRPGEQAIAQSPGAIRQSGWLAIVDHHNQWTLYNLNQDPQQTRDLSASAPQKLLELKTRYINWYNDTRLDEYHPLPIPVGYPGVSITQLPAHEGEIIREGIDYQFTDGWAHDWFTSASEEMGQVRWPLQVTNDGHYRINLRYNTPDQSYDGEVLLGIGDQQAVFENLKTFVGEVRADKRLAHTGEAPTRTWGKQSIELDLRQGLYDLTLSFGQDNAGQKLSVKSLDIERLE